MLEKTLESLLYSKEINKSILKEINSEYLLDGLMMKLNLQYFGHLMQRANSLEKTLMLRKTRDLFKEIRHTNRTFHAKIGTIKTEMVWT